MIDEIILATTTNSRDDKLVIIAKKIKLIITEVVRIMYYVEFMEAEIRKNDKCRCNCSRKIGDSPLTDHKMLI